MVDYMMDNEAIAYIYLCNYLQAGIKPNMRYNTKAKLADEYQDSED